MRVHSQPQPIQGLTADEVAERRTQGLGNVPPQATSSSYLHIIRENVLTTVNTILFAWYPELIQIQSRESEAHLPHGLMPLGAVSLRDTLRPEARETLTRLADVGVQIKVISGDHPQTVAALAKQMGMAGDIQAISGAELETLDAAQLAQVAQEVTIFGRITPQQKERLIQALRSRGHYVAMIGDGVNDVLALKQANLGIAMQSGSQATRGVADLVLLKDTFGVYLAVLLPAIATLPVPGNSYREGALPLAQTALTVFAVLCGLALIVFVQPPSRLDEDGHHRNWPPTLLALGLFFCLVGVLAIAPLRAFFNLQALDVFDFFIIGGAVVLWGMLLHTIWHFHLFERFLQLTWEDASN